MEVLDEKYHIISNGILNREDYFFNLYGRLRDCFNENSVYIESVRRIGELIYKEKDFRFFGRIKRSPKDEANTCISFGNTLLSNEFLNIIWTKGLDPGIGIIHSTN